MKTKVYSVFDAKAAFYGSPFFMPNDGMAIRAFSDIANDSKSVVCAHPEDFTLFHVGFFDDLVGVLESVNPAPLVTGSACKVNRRPEFIDLGKLKDINGVKEVIV